MQKPRCEAAETAKKPAHEVRGEAETSSSWHTWIARARLLAGRVSVSMALVAAAFVVPAAAFAGETSSANITGFEYHATSTDAKFAGTASGALPGSWNADVHHTALCLSCATTGTITGGRFLLATVLDGIPTLITGSFTGGTVQMTNEGANCGNQAFAVNGILGRVGAWHGGSGTGSFRVTLTHYRRSVFGNCVTYGASVGGSITVTP
jgi:hypothetical protein